MRKICFFTGTRAEYGIMSRLFKLVEDDKDLQLQIIATNMHLSPEFGLTYKEIEADGFHIDKKVEMLLSSDTANGTVKSMGLACIGFADALEELQPDMAVILGDRYEMLAAAESCLIYKIPIAHLHGGELTEGAYDDAIRHCITKLSHLHFTSTEEYCQRVIQMGEQPERVFWVGSLGVDNILHEPLMPLEDLESDLSFKLGRKYLLITFHPVTMEGASAINQCRNLLDALDKVKEEYQMLFTMPNSDTDGRAIAAEIEKFVGNNSEHAISVQSLGKRRYYSAMRYASAVIGNSSSGLIEAPSFHIPTLNIGKRQDGRCRGESVLDVDCTYNAIKNGLSTVLSNEFKEKAKTAANPYERKDTLTYIFNIIKTYPLDGLVKKSFYDIK